MKWTSVSAVCALVMLAGCDSVKQAAAPSSSAPAAPAENPISTPATRIGGQELNPLETQARSSSATPAPAPTAASDSQPSPAPAPAPAPATTEQVKAQAGVGIKGKSLEPHSGPVVEPLKQFIRFEQRAVFDVKIPHAMQLFEATEGRKPNSHDEFMSRIIAANNIQLPKLPDGHRYLYVPEKGELMVERPAK